jgi:hypothetical protein
LSAVKWNVRHRVEIDEAIYFPWTKVHHFDRPLACEDADTPLSRISKHANLRDGTACERGIVGDCLNGRARLEPIPPPIE